MYVSFWFFIVCVMMHFSVITWLWTYLDFYIFYLVFSHVTRLNSYSNSYQFIVNRVHYFICFSELCLVACTHFTIFVNRSQLPFSADVMYFFTVNKNISWKTCHWNGLWIITSNHCHFSELPTALYSVNARQIGHQGWIYLHHLLFLHGNKCLCKRGKGAIGKSI
jgi:hypothetical protein